LGLFFIGYTVLPFPLFRALFGLILTFFEVLPPPNRPKLNKTEQNRTNLLKNFQKNYKKLSKKNIFLK
jgi:hypothetical protein